MDALYRERRSIVGEGALSKRSISQRRANKARRSIDGETLYWVWTLCWMRDAPRDRRRSIGVRRSIGWGRRSIGWETLYLWRDALSGEVALSDGGDALSGGRPATEEMRYIGRRRSIRVRRSIGWQTLYLRLLCRGRLLCRTEETLYRWEDDLGGRRSVGCRHSVGWQTLYQGEGPLRRKYALSGEGARSGGRCSFGWTRSIARDVL